jgi:small-conductance mechanosensitive channel
LGILGLAVGFGAKNLVADLIAGFFIILENQFNIGDEVQIGTNRGKVIKISLKSITLRDKEKKTYFIPNSTIKSVIRFPKKQA